MPILPTEANYDNSPFYKIMEDRGKIWSRVAEEIGADISGAYNAYNLEFELSKRIGRNLLKVNGRRQLESVNNRRIIAKDLQVYFSYTGIEKEKHLRIGKKELINFFYNRLGQYNYKLNVDKFSVKFNSEPVVERIFKSGLLSINEINRVTVDSEGIHVKVLDLPKRIEEARKLTDFWKIIV